jgi:serine/threonine-protein kinase
VAKVVDFGLVKRLYAADPSVSANHTIVGTPLFLAPEAIRGSEQVDARSDLYACGALAYYLLTGRPVFEGERLVDVCSQHLFNVPVPPSSRLGRPLPAALERCVLRCLEKDAERRFPSAEALFEALSSCGVPSWTEQEARASWARLDHSVERVSATDRTVSAQSASLLAIDLSERQAGE